MLSANLDLTKNAKLLAWIQEWVDVCQPERVQLCDGSDAENQMLCDGLVAGGTFTRLDSAKRPNSFSCQSDVADVARVEKSTYICSKEEKDAGPTNNWAPEAEMKAKLKGLYAGCMKGRTMYVIPFSMGPIGSDIAKIGVEISDSAYVVVNMRIMARIGKAVLDVLGDGDFIPCVHSVGSPLAKGQADVAWPCNAENKYITHYPETNEIWSYGSGYGGNALLGKKCLALRIASTMAKREGWMAEHMLILKLTNPAGKKFYIAAAFPSACGKTNLAMLIPTIKGWTVECIGDDIAWMKINKEDGKLYAVNPEAGFFGVAPGTNDHSNKNAMESLKENAIFTNCALTEDGDVWWEEMTEEIPAIAQSWTGIKNWTPECGDQSDNKNKASHPNARYTAVAAQCPVIADEWEDPKGVPIDAFLFGGRRPSTVPLVHESFDWNHGTMMGAICASETTAAAESVGQLRIDPFAMIPFCGYNMGDYIQHWLDMGKKLDGKGPKAFYVNWFRKTEDGKWLWPGFGENSRVLAWICDRLEGKAEAVKTPIGFVPTADGIDLDGLDVPAADMEELLKVNKEEWLATIPQIREYYTKFGDACPAEFNAQVDALEARLQK